MATLAASTLTNFLFFSRKDSQKILINIQMAPL